MVNNIKVPKYKRFLGILCLVQIFTPNPARLSSTSLDALLEHGSDPHADVGGHDVHQTEPGETLELVDVQLKTQALTPPLSNTNSQRNICNINIYL